MMRLKVKIFIEYESKRYLEKIKIPPKIKILKIMKIRNFEMALL